MNAFKTSVSALALVALAAGGIGAAALSPSNVYAQATTTAPATPAGQHGKHHGHHHHFNAAARARFLEGRIAFIKAVLQITPAQESAFNGLADAMRANAKDRASAWEQMKANRDKPKTAIDRVETQVQVLKAREAGRERILAAMKPLYDSLTPDQKKVADHLVGGHGHRGHRG